MFPRNTRDFDPPVAISIDQTEEPSQPPVIDNHFSFVEMVEQRRVEILRTAQGLAVVGSGLSEGERVITEGINKVRPGIAVDATMPGDG